KSTKYMPMIVSTNSQSVIICPPLILSIPLSASRKLHREGYLQMFFSQQLESQKWKSMVIAICYIYYSILLTKKHEHISPLCCSCSLSNRAVKPRGFSPEDRRRVPCLGLGRGGNA